MSQSERLKKQNKKIKGAKGIFNQIAKNHDRKIYDSTLQVLEFLKKENPGMEFRHRKSITKKEINIKLNSIDSELGKTLYVSDSKIKPDEGIIEVLDKNNQWRIILVSEAKHQGNDFLNIKSGKKVGVKSDKDIMIAGNAIERAHKNISEIANYMLDEKYFPYIIFLNGSNFLTKTFYVKKPNSQLIELNSKSGKINRLDRLTAANYGMEFNKNLCKNKFINHNNVEIMLQAPSIFVKESIEEWKEKEIYEVMLDISKTSLKILEGDI